MFAIIKSGSKQYKVEEGQVVRVESLGLPEGEKVEIRDVLLVDCDGQVRVGKPSVDGAFVKASVVGNGKADKVIVFKYKRKKQYKRTRGHRQQYTALKIEKITV